MKRLFTFLFVVSVLSATVWAEDVSVKETFSRAPKGALSVCQNKDWQGDVCVWHATGVRRNTGDTIHTATTKQAEWIPMNSTSEGKQDGQKIYTLNWEGGIKAVTFKYARFGSEYKKDQTTGRSLRLRVIAGDMEPDSTAKYDNNTMKLGNGDAANHESYSHSFNCKSANAQLTIENISTFTETNPTGICRILVSDIEITPYLLYRQKDVTIGVKQQGYHNAELINNTGTEGSISYSSSATGVATVDKYGVITPVSVGDAIITATWSAGVTTTYTLHVVNNIIAENFSKVKQPGQTASAEWEGDLFTWEVANVRRGVDDTLGLNPRIQATAFRSNAGSSLVTKEEVEGGVKHVAFDWRQWASGTTPLTIDMYYSASKDSWGDAVATQSVDAVGAAEPHVFSEDIDNGAKGNAYLKLNYTSTKGVAVIGAIKITPWVLYTDKEMKTIHVGENYTNTSLIDNTSGAAEYESSDDAIATVDEYGQVTGVGEGYVTITAKYNNATTTYPMYIAPATNSETFSGESTAATYGTHTNVPEDATTWNTRLGGINYNENFAPNVVFLRAPKDDDTKLGYIESGLLDGGISKLTFYWNLVGNEPDVNKWDIRVLINGREVKRLTNDSGKELDGVTTRQANMTKCVIEDIDEPGRFTIRFENRSTMTGAYTSGNKARFVIDNLFWENHDAPIVLDEGVDNSALLTRNNGSTQDVNTNRTLVGGAWNTLCLPFNIDKTDLGEGVNVQTLDNASIEGDVLSIGFAALAGSTLTAGTPYLVKPESDVNLTGFTDKSIVSMNGVTSVGGGLVILQGIFSPTELTGGDRSVLFVGAKDTNGDNLFYPSVTANLNGMRAYFKVNEAMGAPIRHARFVTDQTNTATGVDSEKSIVESRKTIENGQLVIIRDGVRYDVLGRKK